MLSTKEILGRLRTVREEKLLKQEHLAKQLKIDRTTYIRKEKGHIPISTDEWLKLAGAMDMDASYFFGSDSGGVESRMKKKELLLLKLYRSLHADERRDLLYSVRLMLKGIKRKKVQETLRMLSKP